MLEHVKLLKEAFDKRNNELWWNCNQIYFLADLRVSVPERIEGTKKEKAYCDLSKSRNPWMYMAMHKDYFTYDLMHEWSGLAEYLHKDNMGFDVHEVPLIKYEVTDDHKILITCFVDKDLPLDSKPEDCCEEYKNLTVVQRLEDWLSGQISDGWGENGFLLGFFIGEPKEVYIDNFYQVKKTYERESLDWHWEKVAEAAAKIIKCEENKMDRVSISEIKPEAYEPVTIPVKDIEQMIKTNTWEGSLEQEEVLYNINEGLYPKNYADEVKKLLGI